MGHAFTVRTARPAELETVVGIDDDATSLYAKAGVVLGLTAEHPFAIDERRRWLRSAELGRLFFALDENAVSVGFASLDVLDGEPYLDQLSVRMAAARRGIGRMLLRHAIGWAEAHGGAGLWLTTYGHLPFNRPFYESEGFVVMPEDACGPGVLHHVEEQRRWLPAPEHRVAMLRSLAGARCSQ